MFCRTCESQAAVYNIEYTVKYTVKTIANYRIAFVYCSLFLFAYNHSRFFRKAQSGGGGIQ